MNRRRGCAALLAALLAQPLAAAATPCAPSWPEFDAFAARSISADGRVIDPLQQQTTSEGQGYALFFALVAGDRERFESLLAWTRDNLAGGDFTARLPGWLWGRRADGSWGLLDANPAADADLWLAYDLLEAGRRWHERSYRVLGKLIAHRVLAEETDTLPGLGRSLLPAPAGFHPAPNRWRLNPSYLPIPLLRALADEDADSGWAALIPPAQALIARSAAHGYAPDWTLYDAAEGFLPDAETGATGSYGAIRVYLWAGLLPADDPARAPLLAALSGMDRASAPPEFVDTRSGAERGVGPSGFAAALIPYLRALGNTDAAVAQMQRVLAAGWPVAGYYDSVLTLFALGHVRGLYRFDSRGHLETGDAACASSAR